VFEQLRGGNPLGSVSSSTQLVQPPTQSLFATAKFQMLMLPSCGTPIISAQPLTEYCTGQPTWQTLSNRWTNEWWREWRRWTGAVRSV